MGLQLFRRISITFIHDKDYLKLSSFTPFLPLYQSFPFPFSLFTPPLLFSFPPKTFPAVQLDGFGETLLASSLGSGAELRPPTHFGHFDFSKTPLMTTDLAILLCSMPISPCKMFCWLGGKVPLTDQMTGKPPPGPLLRYCSGCYCYFY